MFWFDIKVLDKCGNEVWSDFGSSYDKERRDSLLASLPPYYKAEFPDHEITVSQN